MTRNSRPAPRQPSRRSRGTTRSRASRTAPASRTEVKAENRRRIVDAASELFATRGYDKTSTKAIAAKAKVAVGTLFKHAPDKEELLFLVMHDRLSQTVDRAFATMPKRGLLEQLMHVFGALYKLYGSMPSVARPFIRATPGASGPSGEQVNALTFNFLGKLGTLVQAAQQRGELAKDVDGFVLVQNLFALYFANLFAWISGHVTIEAALEPGLRTALALQLRGLTRK